MTTKKTWPRSQPLNQQTRHPSIRRPSGAGSRSRNNLVWMAGGAEGRIRFHNQPLACSMHSMARSISASFSRRLETPTMASRKASSAAHSHSYSSRGCGSQTGSVNRPKAGWGSGISCLPFCSGATVTTLMARKREICKDICRHFGRGNPACLFSGSLFTWAKVGYLREIGC